MKNRNHKVIKDDFKRFFGDDWEEHWNRAKQMKGPGKYLRYRDEHVREMFDPVVPDNPSEEDQNHG